MYFSVLQRWWQRNTLQIYTCMASWKVWTWLGNNIFITLQMNKFQWVNCNWVLQVKPFAWHTSLITNKLHSKMFISILSQKDPYRWSDLQWRSSICSYFIAFVLWWKVFVLPQCNLLKNTALWYLSIVKFLFSFDWNCNGLHWLAGKSNRYIGKTAYHKCTKSMNGSHASHHGS